MKPSCLWVASLQVRIWLPKHCSIATARPANVRWPVHQDITAWVVEVKVPGGIEFWPIHRKCVFFGSKEVGNFQGTWLNSSIIICFHIFQIISIYFKYNNEYIYIIYIYHIIYIYEIKTMISANSTLKVVCWETLPSFWRPTGMHLATRLFVCRLSGFQLTNDRLYWAGFKIQLWVLNPNNFVS